MARLNRRRRGNAPPHFGRYLEYSSDYLPEGWIVINEVNEDGVVEYFINVATNQTLYSRKDLLRYVACESRANHPPPPILPRGPVVYCIRCRNTGHQAHQCGFSDAYVRAIHAMYHPPAYGRGQAQAQPHPQAQGQPRPQAHRAYQCSRCGQFGHNARTCNGN